MMLRDMGYPFGQFGSAVTAVFPFLPTPQSTLWGTEQKNRKVFDAVQVLFNNS